MSKPKYWWIKERHNPQLGVYYVPLGNISKQSVRGYENALYGCNILHQFGSEKAYQEHICLLKKRGERVHE